MIKKLENLIECRKSFYSCERCKQLQPSARAKMKETTDFFIDVLAKMVMDEKKISNLTKRYAKLKAARHGYTV